MSYFREKLKSVLKVKESPHRIALAFAFGVFMGVSPFLGLHYVGGIFLAYLFRLNKLVTIVGISVNNPWTIVPISTFAVWVGAKILGIKQVLPEVDWENLGLLNMIKKLADWENFLYVVKQMMPIIKTFFVGSFILCTVSAVISYFIIHHFAAKYKSIKDAA